MTAILEARGYEEIEARAASAYEHWVGSEGLSFRGRDDAERLGDVVKLQARPARRIPCCRGVRSPSVCEVTFGRRCTIPGRGETHRRSRDSDEDG
jgi:hypothetical protein